jgi:hypothetical protein
MMIQIAQRPAVTAQIGTERAVGPELHTLPENVARAAR